MEGYMTALLVFPDDVHRDDMTFAVMKQLVSLPLALSL
jgi:hypothetical protein